MKQNGKRLGRTLCLLFALVFLTIPLMGCDRSPGIYAWYGGRMKADTILRMTVDAGNGKQVYEVPFETYRTVFLYLKGFLVQEKPIDENTSELISKKEQSIALKEVTEGQFTEYYSLVALGESLGIAITETDRKVFAAAHKATIDEYIAAIRESGTGYDGTEEEYAEELYRQALFLKLMTPEYYEFFYFRNLLETRIKLSLAVDMQDYIDQAYFHYRQLVITYIKGDALAEQKARETIESVKASLVQGTDMEELITTYGDSGYNGDIYFDTAGSIVGSSTGNTVNTMTANTIRALEMGKYSDIISGDDSDERAYVAIYQRLPISLSVVCGSSAIGQAMYQYPAVNATALTPYYTDYMLLLDSYEQNMICEPVNDKVYARIAVNTLY